VPNGVSHCLVRERNDAVTGGASVRRRALVSRTNQVEIVSEPRTELAANEALVALRVTGICGSDLHALHSTHPSMKPRYYPGHEVVGVVVEVGDDFNGVSVGQLVTPEPTLPCGHCKMCTTERSNICENLEFFDCGFREGGMADIFSIRADRLHAIPADFDLRQAALIEPLSTPVRAVRLAGGITARPLPLLDVAPLGCWYWLSLVPTEQPRSS